MEQKCNNSAVLDVVIENKDISNIIKETKENDLTSICSNSTFEYSLAQSPSLESFSTLRDTEILSELNVDENYDLWVQVDNPQKHLDTLETYITFRITTKVARIEFSENEYVVRRRYNEFAWLYHKLIECHPFCIVPPLPGKHSLMGQLDRYSKDFIYVRMKLLNTFMCRIAQHPILSCNQHFKMFITTSQSDFTLHRKRRSSTTNNKISLTSNGVTTYVSIKNRHIEFEKMRDYLNVLSDKLGTVEKISFRINKERHDFVDELHTFYPTFMNWSTCEPELASILQSIGNAYEKCTFAKSFMISTYPNFVANPIKEFLLYIDCVKDTLHKREVYQHVYENSLDELNKRRVEKDQLLTLHHSTPITGSFALWKQPSMDVKLEKLGTHIPQLVKKVELNQDNLECANESLRSDLDRWQEEKQKCLKKILLDFVNKQIEYYEKSVNAWENVASDLAAQNISLRNSTKK